MRSFCSVFVTYGRVCGVHFDLAVICCRTLFITKIVPFWCFLSLLVIVISAYFLVRAGDRCHSSFWITGFSRSTLARAYIRRYIVNLQMHMSYEVLPVKCLDDERNILLSGCLSLICLGR